jgi:hypothetical protein
MYTTLNERTQRWLQLWWLLWFVAVLALALVVLVVSA